MAEEDEVSLLISERHTRKKYIDPELEKRGWLKKYIKEEINSVKSDFISKNFVFYDGHPEKNVDRFIDYVLLDEDRSVLAIIEAKRFSKNEEQGRIQARTYAKDIEKQIHKKIPIFLTNGRIWLFIDEFGIETKVSGPFSQEDLSRLADLFKNRRDPRSVQIDTHIIDRSRSKQIVVELSEHFAQGHRKALIHMATGTGKTRVAMSIISVLINANIIRNVLFLADRIALANQAKANGFKQFFTEPVVDLREGFSTTGRMYISTIQTMMGGSPKRLFERFSPGFFDLIIYDEAHRSIYDKSDLIFRYFYAIKVGLTATPREHESKNTYDKFGCETGIPTVEYSYDEAIVDGVLVPYRGIEINTQNLALGIKGTDLTKDLKDQLRRQELIPEETEFTGNQFDRVFMDDKTNELIIREFMDMCYKSDEGKPCKTIVFCASQRHAEHMKKIFGKVFPLISNEVQKITSDMDRAEDEVKRFQLESEPRIALSVGMLDTGIDVPEVCNLVFVKPVFSHIRFWQMFGRGTRNLNACKHPEWLPNREKKDFLIFDFLIGGHSNIEYHSFTASPERPSGKDVITRIFENRVKLLEKPLDESQKTLISKKILDSINALDRDSFIVREKIPTIQKIEGASQNLGGFTGVLLKEISPLMITGQGENVNVSSFILQVEKLFDYVLDRKIEQIDKIHIYVAEMCENILRRESLSDIHDNRDKILDVLQERFWEDLTFEDVEFLVSDIAPLMKYYEPDPRKVVQIDAPDLVLTRRQFEKEIKEDTELKEFLGKNPLIKKIKDGGITAHELLELEFQLSSLRPSLTIENVQKYQKVDFLRFLREIIGLSYEYDPKEMIERRFDEFIIETSHYNAKQLEFLIVLKKVFSQRKHIEITDLANPPLANEHPLDYFQIEDLKSIIKKCNEIKMK